MSHSSKIFEEQPIRVQNLNGFDLSHMSSGTAYCGTLTPVLSRLTMQGMKFSLGCALQVELPPLATQAFGRIDAHVEVFWTPCSVLYGGWKSFIANNPETSFILSQANYEQYDLPVFAVPTSSSSSPYGTISTLDAQNYCVLDYLGFSGGLSGIFGNSNLTYKMLSILNYHKVWDVFYRNPQVTRTIFAVNPDTNGPGFSHNVAFVHHSYYSSLVANSSPLFNTDADTTFPDGISMFSLRQRNYGNDYFTSCSLNPQQGNPSTVGFSVDLNTGDGEFSISALRMANSLQVFRERANYDPTYTGIMRANFGFTPGDAGYDEPVYLGRLVVPVYQKGVYLQGAAGYASNPNTSGNPFITGSFVSSGAGSLGAKAASGSFNGSGEIVTNFKCKSWGYLLGLFSLVPHAQYSYGIDRDFMVKTVGEHPFPVLQNVGMDAVKQYEIYATSANIAADTDFAYLPRYSYHKYVNDSTHGELRPGKSLSSFIIQRAFASAPSFNTAFLEIGRNDLDSLFAVSSSSMKFTCWYECFWVFKAVMPLAEFCVPTLGDMTEDTHKITVHQGGSRL